METNVNTKAPAKKRGRVPLRYGEKRTEPLRIFFRPAEIKALGAAATRGGLDLNWWARVRLLEAAGVIETRPGARRPAAASPGA